MISRFGPWWSRTRLAALLVALPCLPSGRAEVQLELRIPPAETYVLGDPIPLFWRFTNLSSSPLGFLWEGCCRLNGRLEVRLDGADLETVPPSQALAHMFAKADQLDPGVTKAYETKVSDWVTLPGTGIYELQGIYRGVLPSQSPQIPRRLELWRGTAHSPSLPLQVLSIRDYLAQADDRALRRGVRVRLDGHSRLSALQPTPFQVAFENLSDQPQAFTWPKDAALWVVNPQGARAVPAAGIHSPTRIVTLPPGGRVVREFTLEPDSFEGEPLDAYAFFVDFRDDDTRGSPRVPSNLLPVTWALGPDEVTELLKAAAKGSSIGARNAPLKLLRVYLAEIGGVLERLDRAGMESGVADLADRLARAAQLKVIAPKPGTVDFALAVPPVDSPHWIHPVVARVAERSHTDFLRQMSDVLALRRHLGWGIRVVLEPEQDTPLEHIASITSSFEPLTTELVAAPAVHIPMSSNTPPAGMTFGAEEKRVPGPTVRWTDEGRAWSMDGVHFVALTRQGDEWVWPAEVRASGQLAVLVEPEISWGALVQFLRPILRSEVRYDLFMLKPRPGA